MEKFMKQLLIGSLLLAGCASADQVKELTEQVNSLQEKVEKLEKAPPAKAAATAQKAGAEVDKDAETAAQAMLKDMQDLMGKGEIDNAKAKLTELTEKYSSTRTYRRAQKLGAELEVFGKDAPTGLKVDEWFIGDTSAVNLSKGTTLLVFWEVWCPHCKREVPNLQKTFDTYKGKGLQMVGLTKLTRSSTKEKAMDFLKEKNVTYPVAKEDGELSKHFNVSGIPAAAVVKDGKIVWRGHPARLSDSMLEGWLN
jgi:thioredoxin-like negative regulator of GroEL